VILGPTICSDFDDNLFAHISEDSKEKKSYIPKGRKGEGEGLHFGL